MTNNKYENGKIYRIVCNITGLQYYGSTCATLEKRLIGHKNDYNYRMNENASNMTSFKIIENGNYEILLVELFPCNSKDELLKREGFYIKNNVCVNKVLPGRTHVQSQQNWVENNKFIYDEYQKKWREENKTYQKQWQKKNNEHLKKYCKKRWTYQQQARIFRNILV